MEAFSFSSLSHYLRGLGYIPGGESRIWFLQQYVSFRARSNLFWLKNSMCFAVNVYMKLDLLGSMVIGISTCKQNCTIQQKHGMHVGKWHKPATATKHGYEACSEFNY